jgi:protoporphyrinogen oxidase
LSEAACDADRKITSNQRIYPHPAQAIMYVQKTTNTVMQTAAINASAQSFILDAPMKSKRHQP